MNHVNMSLKNKIKALWRLRYESLAENLKQKSREYDTLSRENAVLLVNLDELRAEYEK